MEISLRNKLFGLGALGVAVVAILVASWRPGRDAVMAAEPAAGLAAAQDTKSGAAKGGGPAIEGCPVFPVDNVWNTRVDHLRIDAHSSAYVATVGPDKPVHPDFGPDPKNGIPFSFIHYNQKRVKVPFEYSDESDLGNYPIPQNPKVEGGEVNNPDGDRHIILIDTDRCELYELYAAKRQPDGSWKAGSGIQMDLTSNAIRGEGKGSADAAGLPIFPGLVRYDEVATGEIRHAIRFTVPKTQRAFVWPGRHYASPITDVKYPPMGTRFRLKADVDISKFSKSNQVILTALKRYGMILADNGGPWFLSGVPDERWNGDDLHRLQGIKGSDLEAVDESDWPYIANSGRVDPMAGR
jgi:hypothetical protein